MQTYTTDIIEGMTAQTVNIKGANGDTINAYFARPSGKGPYPGMVLIHHMPGWDEWYREATRRYAHHGYMAISPNLYCRAGHGTVEDVTAKVRAAGGVPDDQMLGDCQGANQYLRALPELNGKVGVFGTCSGGRQTFLVACRGKDFNAAVECWGGGVVQKKEELSPAQPVAPHDYTKDLSCPPSLASLATMTRGRRRSRSTSMRRNSKNTARTMSSTDMTGQVMDSFTTTEGPIGKSKQWTAGRRSGSSLTST